MLLLGTIFNFEYMIWYYSKLLLILKSETNKNSEFNHLSI